MPVRLVLPLLVCCLPAVLSAQSAADAGAAPASDAATIRAIQLERKKLERLPEEKQPGIIDGPPTPTEHRGF